MGTGHDYLGLGSSAEGFARTHDCCLSRAARVYWTFRTYGAQGAWLGMQHEIIKGTVFFGEVHYGDPSGPAK